jgi:hypothetical protein
VLGKKAAKTLATHRPPTEAPIVLYFAGCYASSCSVFLSLAPH